MNQVCFEVYAYVYVCMYHLAGGKRRPQRLLAFPIVRVGEAGSVVEDDSPDADGSLLELQPQSSPLRVAQKRPEQTAVKKKKCSSTTSSSSEPAASGEKQQISVSESAASGEKQKISVSEAAANTQPSSYSKNRLQ